jgi:predicted permease
LIEKSGFLGWTKFVSAYVERDKKILKNLIFAFALPALLIDFPPTRQHQNSL